MPLPAYAFDAGCVYAFASTGYTTATFAISNFKVKA